MAGAEAQAVGPRTPGASGQTSPGNTTTKLRDSCQACAMSKVKCPKEKPTCSRCESRNLSCEYIFTRRPGRRRDASRLVNTGTSTRSSSTFDNENGNTVERDTIQAFQPSVGACFLTRSTTPSGGRSDYLDMSPQTLSIPATPRPDQMYATETSDVLSALHDVNMFSSLTDFGCDGNDMDFIMSAMDSPFGIPALENGGIPQAQSDIGSLLIPSQGINIDLKSSEITSSVRPISTPSEVTTRALAQDMQVLANARSEVTQVTDTTSCGCLTQSLDLLKTLSAQPASQPNLSASEPQEVSLALTYGPSHSVLTENKQSIEAVSERLTCPYCTGDSFLLAVLSMTVLKILERYAAAARVQSSSGAKASDSEGAEKASRLANSILASSKDQMMVLSRTYNTPRNRGRQAAQLVLSELHRVQKLVNQLSPRLKRSKAEVEAQKIEPELELWGRQSMAWCYDRGPATPFSATTLGQMESDVRKSLSALSSEIINGLRRS